MTTTSRTVTIVDDAVVALQARYPRGCGTDELVRFCVEFYDALSDADRRLFEGVTDLTDAVWFLANRRAA